MSPEPGSSPSLFHAGAALAATVCRIHRDGVRDRPDARVRAAVGGTYADLWACTRLTRAGEVRESAATVARYLVPRILLDAADGLAAAWGDWFHEDSELAADHRHHVGRLADIAAAPGAGKRLRDVAARIPSLATGDDRLAHPLTAVPPAALRAPLGRLVRALEDERRAVLRAAASAAQTSLVDGRFAAADDPGLWALADRYALLALAAECLDGWRLPSTSQARPPGDDRACLTGELARIAAGLGLAPGVTGQSWHGTVYALATSGGADTVAGAPLPRREFARAGE
ncbi:hypothetical protein ACFCVY_24475 [Streptomyces sp. NPDC056411]|uniref:hypothetical protein n=1 Tax=Streptomyces sp. NPDC056411 TaxID=3345813 RepID=UPI0035D6B3CE